MFLLQIDSTAVAAESANKSLWELLIMGGWPMVPLVLLLILAIFITIERYLIINKANEDPEPFLKQVRKYVLEGDIKSAKTFCDSHDSPFSRMIHKGISRLGTPLTDIEASIENVGKLEVYRLEKGLSVLATIAGAGPMIGFFGTVIGMINAFMEIAMKGGNVNPTDLAGGIYEAMVTTAFGLLVGIVGFLAYNWLVTLVNGIVYKLEIASTDFIDLLQEPA